ncbi:thiosulfate sulfurtransferase [Candidatus Caldarchaeum subterraneum]|uniref:Rhodanese domain protein n=2 Tax=Thermoproteati TaxID=1783275 RepID=H5SGF9_9CREN|nr:rhodanese domain protein [Candidatus Caldarchaeum subterraneum]BAJ51045.1 thiosulfate sulfurtransferase [Candidatus Caldarchaeum subterraneum]BAL55245.1 rhodanese domain protein [uncultured crenarchaeote]
MTQKPVIPRIISPDTLLNNLDNYVVIDVRRLVEYRAGHIPRAYSCSFSHFIKLVGVALYPEDPDKISSLLAGTGVEKNTPIVIYDNFYGRHSCRVSYTLELLGFENISILNMTFDEYTSRRYPVSTETPPRIPNHRLELQYTEELLIDAKKIREIVAQKPRDTLLIDTRDTQDYGVSHIPRAINIPWHVLYKPGKLFDIESIKKAAYGKNIDDSKRLVFYCEEGTSSAFAMYGFRAAGFLNTHTYLPSYPDWLNML